VSISSKQWLALPKLTLLQIVLKVRVAHPTPPILNHLHHTQLLKKERSDRRHGNRIMQGRKSGRKCVLVIWGGRRKELYDHHITHTRKAVRR